MAETEPTTKSQRKRRVHTPTVLQMEAVECGAASLAIILGYYKRFVPLEELRLACGVSRDGSNASNVLRAARAYGLEAHGYKREPEALEELGFPSILFWNMNHFVVLEGFKKDKVFINDPAAGPRTVSRQEFDQAFTGVVLTFKPGPEFKTGGKPEGIVGSLLKRVRGSETAMAYLIVAGLALVIPGLVVPIFTKIFVDDYLVGQLQSWIKPLLLGMGITLVLRGGLTWLKEYYLIRFETKLALGSAGKFFWHVLHLPVVFYAQRSAGDISSRVAINDKVAQILSRDFGSAGLDVLMVGFYAILMFFYDGVLTSVGIGIAVLNIVALHFVARKRKDANKKLLQDTGKLMGASMNGLAVIETLKASGGETDFFSHWAGYQGKVVNGMQDMGSATLPLSSVPPLLSALNTALILSIGGLRVMDGHLTMGALVAFQSLMASFIAPVNKLVGLGGKLQEMHGDMMRLDDVMRYDQDPLLRPERVTGGEPVAGAPGSEDAPGEADTPAKLAGDLELRGLTFGYSRLAPPLLEDFHLKLRPGSRVALVGPSGCGKSTISRLVMGLYEPWAGEILFDGKPRGAWPRHLLVNSLAMVDQDITMFEGTIRDNLCMWDHTVPDSRLIAAAKDACVHDIIAGRPGGYDSRVGEGGTNFSGGQRQRLEIARALVNNPSIVVLDEATSALDPMTEKLVDDNLRRRGCTCLIVAHRLSTIRDCDEIVVLRRGQVVQRGTHEEMKDAEGLYGELIRAI